MKTLQGGVNVAPVAILGGGTIGASWAALLVARGWPARIYEPISAAHERCRQLFERHWQRLSGVISASEVPPLTISVDLGESLIDAVYVLECAPERLELKRALYASVEALTDFETIIASCSSALQPTQLQKGMKHPERMLVAHPFNPPHLVPLVELVAGEATKPSVVDSMEQLLRSLGKVTIRVQKELTGHVANRLTAALWREAVHLVSIGAASVRDIDLAMTVGPGLRWATIGPHLGYHLAGGTGGIRHYLEHLGPAQQARWAELGAPKLDKATCDLLVAGVGEEAGNRTIDEIEEERDRRLCALLSALGLQRSADD